MSKIDNMQDTEKMDSNSEERMHEMQVKYIQAQAMDQQMQQIHQQIEHSDLRIQELRQVIMGIEEFKLVDIKKDKEVMVPISNGIFFKAELKDNQKFIVNVGSEVMVEKTVDQTIAILKEQETELLDYQQHLVMQFQKIAEKMEMLDRELRDL